jgi:predicted Zn-dependent peptidase
MPDRELPLVTATAMIKAGSIWEPEGKEGLAALCGATMRAGGTQSMSPPELDEALEFLAISVETGIGKESGSASLSVLSKNMEKGLAYFADVIMNPRFDQGRFDLAKARMQDGVRRENDEPTEAAERELEKLIYHGSVYGRVPTLESVTAVTRDDVADFHKKYFSPKGMILGVTGDFDEKEMLARLEAVFGGWSAPAPVYPATAPVKEEFSGGVWIAGKDVPQSAIRMGHLAGLKSDPDYLAVRVMDNILGGSGFTSRMVQKVRVDRGLAYSVWSYTMAGHWAPGIFLSGAETKVSTTAEAIGLMLAEIKRIREEPVSPQELEEAKNSIINSFVFVFDRPSKILAQRITLEYYGMPLDFLETYRDKAMAVTAEDVRQAARRRLKPEGLKIVVVGAQKDFDRPLGEFGPVNKIALRDYSAEGGK